MWIPSNRIEISFCHLTRFITHHQQAQLEGRKAADSRRRQAAGRRSRSYVRGAPKHHPELLAAHTSLAMASSYSSSSSAVLTPFKDGLFKGKVCRTIWGWRPGFY